MTVVTGTIEPRVKAGTLERRRLPLTSAEIRKSDSGTTFVGLACPFDELSEDLGGFRERFQRGAFRKVLARGVDCRMTQNHNEDIVLGRTKSGTLRLSEGTKGLNVEDDFPDTTTARDLAVIVERGDVDQMSFLFRVRPNGSDVWEEIDGELVRTVIEVGELIDVCLATYPAYTQTSASMRSLLGVEVFDDAGEPREDPLRELAWRIFRGEVDATDEERALVDGALARLETVSPWTAQRALMAASQEPELQGVVQGKRVRFEDAPPDEGEGPSWSLAARQRRLSELAHDLEM